MLEVNGLSVDYAGIQALVAVSLTVEPGHITAVIGSNGAGKSSLLRAISRLVPVAAGEILLDGRRIDRLAPASVVAAGIAHVPEGRELFPRMSVAENLLLGAHLRRDRKAIRRDLERAFAMFPVLETKAQNQARSLSGGEQQMLAFCRAMMSRPKLLLLDEPSIGLAPLIEAQLMHSIVDLCRDTGVGVLLVEQNARAALEISTFAYVVELGSVALRGPSAKLIGDPAIHAAYLGRPDQTEV